MILYSQYIGMGIHLPGMQKDIIFPVHERGQVLLLWRRISYSLCIKVDMHSCYGEEYHIPCALRWTGTPGMGKDIIFPLH